MGSGATHMLVGGLIGYAAGFAVPGSGVPLILVGMVAGLVPDLDMVFEHRKTLHLPVYASVAALLVLPVFLAWPGSVTALLFVLPTAMGVHGLMDVLGGGKELRYWEETDDRAVYNHAAGRWMRARRVLHDGSAADLAVAVAAAIPLLAVENMLVQGTVAVLLLVQVGYTMFRRRIGEWIPRKYPTFSALIQDMVRPGSVSEDER